MLLLQNLKWAKQKQANLKLRRIVLGNFKQNYYFLDY